jgi:hypothetical protein
MKVIGTASALDYARIRFPALVHTTEILDTMAYRELAKEVLSETGEQLPGVEVTEEYETFRVTFGKEEME